jgi:predicted PurR-regulated permease PerM
VSASKTATKQSSQPTVEDTEEAPPSRTQLEIPFRTFAKVAAFIVVLLATYKLWPLISGIIMATLLAGVLKPGVEKLERHMPRWSALLLLVLLFITVFVGLMSLILPTLADQIVQLGKDLPNLKDRMLQHLPKEAFVQESADKLVSGLTTDKMGAMLTPLLSTGGMLLGGVGEMLLVVVMAFYIAEDEGRIVKWFLAFFRPATRVKCEETVKDLSQVIFSYATGQATLSLCVMLFTFISLTLLKVPGATMLALLAALMDLLPVLGFVISSVPALLLALSVSFSTALIVLGLYLVYHGFENYLLVPRIYGKNLQVSSLGVLLGFLSGFLLAGVPGAIAALPIVAAYPIIERIWLADYLGQRVVRKHEAQKEEQFGSQ